MQPRGKANAKANRTGRVIVGVALGLVVLAFCLVVTLVGLVASDPLTRRTYPVATEAPLEAADEETPPPPPVAGQPAPQP